MGLVGLAAEIVVMGFLVVASELNREMMVSRMMSLNDARQNHDEFLISVASASLISLCSHLQHSSCHELRVL